MNITVPLSSGDNVQAGRLSERMDAAAIPVAITVLTVQRLLLIHSIVIPSAARVLRDKNLRCFVELYTKLLVPNRHWLFCIVLLFFLIKKLLNCTIFQVLVYARCLRGEHPEQQQAATHGGRFQHCAKTSRHNQQSTLMQLTPVLR